MNRSTLGPVLRALAVLSLAAASCQPAGKSSRDTRTWWVDQTNSTGVSDGRRDTPLLSIQDAIEASGAGDEIRVAGGRYFEILDIDHAVSLIGEGSASTVIDGSGGGPVILVDRKVRDVTVEGFSFENASDDVGAVCNVFDVGITFRRCFFQNCDITPGSPTFTPGVLRFAEEGVYRVEQCVFFDNDNNAIGGSLPGSLVIENCVMAFQSRLAVQVGGSPDTTKPDFLLDHATLVRCAEGVRVGQYTDTRMSNLIIANNATGIRESDIGGDPHLVYVLLDDVYRDADTDELISDPAVVEALDPPGDNVDVFGGDPLFVDEAAGDVHLLDGSPAIDRGDPKERDTDGSRSDLGAYGGPGGDFDTAPPQDTLGLGFHLRSGRDPAALLEADPEALVPGSFAEVDLDLDGEVERLEIDPRGAVHRTSPRRRGPWQRPLPPGLRSVERLCVRDLDGDGRFELVFRTRGSAPRDVQVASVAPQGRGSYWVTARPGDRVEVWSLGQTVQVRPVGRTGDREDGALLFGTGTGRVDVRIVREGQVVGEFFDVRSGDELCLAEGAEGASAEAGHAADG